MCVAEGLRGHGWPRPERPGMARACPTQHTRTSAAIEAPFHHTNPKLHRRQPFATGQPRVIRRRLTRSSMPRESIRFHDLRAFSDDRTRPRRCAERAHPGRVSHLARRARIPLAARPARNDRDDRARADAAGRRAPHCGDRSRHRHRQDGGVLHRRDTDRQGARQTPRHRDRNGRVAGADRAARSARPRRAHRARIRFRARERAPALRLPEASR